MNKPFSEACERNKYPILEKLKLHFSNIKSVFEIGSGTGQHAVYFSEMLPDIIWQTSDLLENHSFINMWINDSHLSNIKAPLYFEADSKVSGFDKYDAVFTANTLHIMSWENVKQLFPKIEKLLKEYGLVFIYGPFNYDGKFTSESNQKFDTYLKANINPMSGIRNIEDIILLAKQNNLMLVEDYEMPANNRLLLFKKSN